MIRLADNPHLKAALDRKHKLLNDLKTLTATPDADWSEEHDTKLASYEETLDTLEREIDRLKSRSDARQKAAEKLGELQEFAGYLPQLAEEQEREEKRVVLPRGARVKTLWFQRDSRGESLEAAYRFGKWFMGGPCGSDTAASWCKEYGIPLKKDATEGINSAGGYIVPEEFEFDLIDLRESYGLFRQFAKVSTMRSDTKSVPRRTSGLTAYPIGETDAISKSQKGWDRVGLVAKKWGTLSKFSSELSEDALIDIGNDLAQEISYAFATTEDDCGFNGDGTGAYHGITGLQAKFKGLSGTIANIAGLFVGTGTGYGTAWKFILDDFSGLVGLLPQYADTNATAFYAHRTFYFTVMQKLMLASGGVTAREVMEGVRNPMFMGYPVRISQKLPAASATNQVACYFGDMSLAVMFGDRRQTTIALSEHSDFANDEIAIRGTERFDINVHDIGNANATAANRVSGPLVGLITGSA
jgi:HK97 family phage major capsid protein